MTSHNEFYPEGGQPLLPCPFCGGEPAITFGTRNNTRTVDVVCQDCYASMPEFCEEGAIQDWNRRPVGVAQGAPDKRLAKIQAIAHDCREAACVWDQTMGGRDEAPKVIEIYIRIADTLDAALALPSTDVGGGNGS